MIREGLQNTRRTRKARTAPILRTRKTGLRAMASRRKRKRKRKRKTK
jgi:hypothetical protein